MVNETRGVIFIHSAVAALCPHIEWAIGAVMGHPVHAAWTPQPAQPGTMRTELVWEAADGTCSRLVSALLRCRELRFEVTQDANPDMGERYAYTPELGVFHTGTDAAGNVQVAENRLRAVLDGQLLSGNDLRASLDDLLGAPWDAELDVFRHASEDAPVRWLTRAV
jgi:hypothetical protein